MPVAAIAKIIYSFERTARQSPISALADWGRIARQSVAAKGIYFFKTSIGAPPQDAT